MGNSILIAEDFGDLLGILSRHFALAGFTVYPAATCAEALKLAGEHRPDCFLLDYHLPDGKAADICRFVRDDEYLKKAPIIILSGDHKQAMNSYELCQADVFVEKGRPFSEIVALTKSQLRHATWERGLLKKPDITLDAMNRRIVKGDKLVAELSHEQFLFFAKLFERSPEFVPEEEVLRCLVSSGIILETRDAMNMLAYRLRLKLGAQLARRIKKKPSGWVYVQPRFRPRRKNVKAVVS